MCIQVNRILQDSLFLSTRNKSKHEYWLLLCDIIQEKAGRIELSRWGASVEDILRVGLRKYTDQAGKLWCCLCDYFIKTGRFDDALNTYDEALKCNTALPPLLIY